MSCNYYRGQCLYLNGKEDGCKGCPVKKAYNKGVRDTKKDYERPEGEWEVEENDEYFCRCSNCKKNTVPRYTHKPAYCDKCGAIMRNSIVG